LDSSTEPDTTLNTQVAAGQPLGVRIAWRSGGAHFILIVGAGPNDMLTVKDPIYGLSYLPLATLANNYQGDGDWTHSYFTR
jgi:hypothetical protein